MSSRCYSLLLAAFFAFAASAPVRGQFADTVSPDDTFGRADRGLAPGSDDQRISRDLLQELRVAELLQDRGDDEKAVDAYRGVYGKLKKILEDDHPLLLHILDSVTDIRVGQGKPEEAEGPLTKVITLRERQLTENPDPGETARMGAGLVKLGRIYGMTGKPEAAIEPLGRGRSILEGMLGSSHDLVVDIDRLVGEAAWDVGHFNDADEWLRRVLEALTDSRGEQSSLVAAIRNQVGVLALVRERYADAAAVWSDVAIGTSPAEGQAGLDAIDRLRWLAVATAFDGDLPEAAMIALRCRRAAEMRIGGTAADVTCDLAMLAMFLELAGRQQEADSLFERFAAAARSSEEVPAPHRCEQLRMIAATMIERGRIDRAATVLLWVLACDERRPASSLASVINDKVLIAECLLGAGDLTAAGKLLEEVLAASQRLLGSAHYRTIDAVVLLAVAAAARGDTVAAAEAAEALVRRAPPAMNPRREAAMAELISAAAALVENGGEAERAAALRDGWLKLRGAGASDATPAVADILVFYGNALVALGEVARAVPFYEQARDQRIKLVGPEHPTVAAVLLPLGRAYETLGRIAEAQESARQGLTIWEATVGLEHPVTLETARSLASAYEAAGDLRSAGPLYERLLAECERRKGPVDLEVASLLTKLAESKAVVGEVAAAELMLKRAIDIQALAAADPSAVRGGVGQDVSPTTVSSTSLEKARDIAMRATVADSAGDLLASLGTGRPEGYGLATLDQRGGDVLPSSRPPSGRRVEATAANDETSESRQVEVASVQNARSGNADSRMADMLLAMGDTRAAWPYVMAGLQSASSDALAEGEALVRAAIVEADAGRVRLAWGRLAEARAGLIEGLKAIAVREDSSPMAAKSRVDDRRLFRFAVQYAEGAFACGDPARAIAAIRKTMSIPPLVAAATLADRDHAISLLMQSAALAGDSAAAKQAADDLLELRRQSFGPADLRSVTAEACAVALDYRGARASSTDAAAAATSIDTVRQSARKWLQSAEPATPDALTQGVADLISIVIDTLAASTDEGSATDRQFADALRDRTLAMAESLQAAGQLSLFRLAAAAAAADPRPEKASRAAAEGLREGPLVRPSAGMEAADIRTVQAAMLAAIGEGSWKDCLEEDAARAAAALAARQTVSTSGLR